VGDAHAGIHYHLHTSRAGSLRGLFIGNALLHPDRLRADLDRLIHNRRDVLGLSKDLHQIHFFWDGGEIGVGFFIQDFGGCGIDRDDAVSLVF